MGAEKFLKFWRESDLEGEGVWGAAANEFQFFSIRPFFLKNIDLNKKSKFFHIRCVSFI